MNDLNAPLGMNNRPPPEASKPRIQPTNKSKKFAVFIGFIFSAIIALNAYTLLSTVDGDENAIVRLPEVQAPVETAATTNDQATTETNETPEVEIVYGDPDLQSDDGAVSELPLPAERESVIQVSPGGPRIITVRDPTAIEIGQPPDQAHLPVDEALEESPYGKLPIRTSSGRRPVDIYARPWSRAGGKRITLVISGLGLSQTGTQRALAELPPEITLAFAPTGNSLDRWMREARKKGHEVLIQVPMEPFNYPQVNPGPNTLRLASSAETNIDNLHWALGKITNYTGIMNYLGARFMSDETAMKPIFDELGKRGLLYFNDGSRSGGSNIGANALRAGVPYLSGNLVIDTSNDPGSIRAKLKALESLSEARGEAIGSGSALELTIKEVAQWANDAKKRGFEIVGVAALSKDPERSR
ncbi:MAG: divergent polysaccharide deacetylase family protein [Pseudomonadota bacterium]